MTRMTKEMYTSFMIFLEFQEEIAEKSFML